MRHYGRCDVESVPHFFLLTDPNLTNLLLLGDLSFDRTSNIQILNVTMNYILSTKRFEESLF